MSHGLCNLPEGCRPATTWFDAFWPSPHTAPARSIAGEPGSVAVMSVREDGGVSGLAMRGNASWAIGRPGADQVPAAGNGTAPMTAAPLSSKKAQAMAADVRPPFTCANDGANFGGLGPAVAEEAADQPASRKLKQVGAYFWRTGFVVQLWHAALAASTLPPCWRQAAIARAKCTAPPPLCPVVVPPAVQRHHRPKVPGNHCHRDGWRILQPVQEPGPSAQLHRRHDWM